MPDHMEPAGPALPKNVIPVPLIPAAGRTPGRRPLPDAQAICSFAIPEIAPPYDDPAPVRRQARGAGRDRPGERSGEAGFHSPLICPPSSPCRRCPGPSRRAPSRRALRRRTGSRGRTSRAVPAPGRVSSPRCWPRRWLVPGPLTRSCRGRRSRLGDGSASLARCSRPPTGPRVRRVIVSSPASGVLEMTVIVGLGAHVRAVAVRLERAVTRPPGSSSEPGDTRQIPPVRPTASRRVAAAYHRRPPGSGEWLCTAIEAA